MPVELQHREEARDDDAGLRRAGDELPKAQRARRPQQRDDHGGLVADRHERRVQVVEPDVRDLLRGEGHQRDRGEVVLRERPDELGHGVPVLLVEAHRPHVPPVLTAQAPLEPRRHLLERPVLQQAGEEQVARLEEGDRFGIHELPLRQQPRDLHVEQRRRDDEELGCLFELLLGIETLQIRDELVGDLRQRDLGDVELVPAEERQQQVDRAVEPGERHAEARLGRGCLGRGCLRRPVPRRRSVVRRRRHGRPAPARDAGTPGPPRARGRTG